MIYIAVAIAFVGVCIYAGAIQIAVVITEYLDVKENLYEDSGD